MGISQDLKDIHNSTADAIQTINKRTDDDQVAIFDPRVKFASKKEEAEAAIVWSSKSIELALDAINEGQGLRVSPFLKNNPNLRKPNLLFQYTEEELMEIFRCRKDIVYFAEKYVYLKTEKGLQHIKLRPYQKKLLKSYQENRWNITLQPRQSGKCLTFNNNLKIRFNQSDDSIVNIDIGELYNLYKRQVCKMTLRERVISFLWKLYKLLDKFK